MRNISLCLLAAALLAAISFILPNEVHANNGNVFLKAARSNTLVINQQRGPFGRVRSQQVIQANPFGGVNVTTVQNRGLFGRRRQASTVSVNPTFVARGHINNQLPVLHTNPFAVQAKLISPSQAFALRTLHPAFVPAHPAHFVPAVSSGFGPFAPVHSNVFSSSFHHFSHPSCHFSGVSSGGHFARSFHGACH